MKLFENSIFIHAPPADVFRVISDPRSKLIWVPAIRRVEMMYVEGEPGLGTKYIASSGAGPFEFAFHEQIVEWSENQHVAYHGRSVWGNFKTIVFLRPAESGTDLYYCMDYSAPGGFLGETLLHIFAFFIRQPMNTRAGERLKEVVENGNWPVGLGIRQVLANIQKEASKDLEHDESSEHCAVSSTRRSS